MILGEVFSADKYIIRLDMPTLGGSICFPVQVGWYVLMREEAISSLPARRFPHVGSQPGNKFVSRLLRGNKLWAGKGRMVGALNMSRRFLSAKIRAVNCKKYPPIWFYLVGKDV